MDKFERDKYEFAVGAPALFAVGKDIEDARRKQINDIINEMYEYKTLVKDLVVLEPTIKQRNIILNLAFYIVNDTELLEKFQRTKEIPVTELRRTTLVSKHFVEKWYDYLVTYVIIFANPYYKLVQDYMRIIENNNDNAEEKVVEDIDSEKEENVKIEKEENNIVEFKNSDELRGIIFSKNKRSMNILTSTGEFKKVKNNKEANVGEEGVGSESKRIKDYKVQIAIILGIILVCVFVFFNEYKKIDRTVLVKTTSQVKLDVNPFGRVIYMYSGTGKGKELIDGVDGLNENLDTVLKDIIKYSNENKMMPDGKILISITGDPIKYGTLKETGKYILDNKINIVINNAGNEHKLYEIMKKEIKDK